MRTPMPFLLSAALLIPAHADAFQTYIDEFHVIRDGSAWFVDGFDDGVPPPSSPDPGFRYNRFSHTDPGLEAGGKFRFDHTNARGVPGNYIYSARLSDRRGTPAQLGMDESFAVSALFDLRSVEPGETIGAGEAYGIALADRPRGGGLYGSDVIELQVALPKDGQANIRFRRPNYRSGSITYFDMDPVSGADADQVRLILAHPAAGTHTVFASYELLEGGVSQGIVEMTPSRDVPIFRIREWTQPEFHLTSPIPEPQLGLLMVAGLVVLGAARWRDRAWS